MVYQDKLRKKRFKKKLLRVFIFFLLSILLFVGISYFLFFSPIFLIKGIKFEGNVQIKTDDLKDYVYKSIRKSFLIDKFKPKLNLILINKDRIEADFVNNFILIDQAKVEKDWFNKLLVIKIKERKEVGILCNIEDRCFYFDNQGVMFKEAPKIFGLTSTILIEDKRNKNFNLGSKFDNQEIMNKILETKDILDKIGKVKYSNFYIPSESFGEFWVITDEGWKIYLDRDVDLELQLIALKKMLEEKMDFDKRKNLQYVDLRINNRIYYK